MNSFVTRLACLISTATAFGVVACAASPVAAQGDLVHFGSCDGATVSQPFLPWLDPSSYKLAPGGDFEGAGGGWSLQGGAATVSGSESFAVTGSLGASSLSLPAGASGTAPPTCVNAAYPTFRLFARTDDPGTTLAISVVYSGPLGTVTVPVGAVAPTKDWQPTPPMLSGSAVPGLLSGGTAKLSVRVAAVGGTAQIDDVYVDPWGRG